MTNNIVNLTVNLVSAPEPNNLQQMGVIISQGATNLEAGNDSLVTQPSDLTAIAATPLAITSITWLAGVATVTTAAPHGIPNGDIEEVVIAGAVPVGYNGTFAGTSTGASSFTYPLATNPNVSPATTPGTWTPEDSVELNAQITTFFAQGSNQSVYVLELGEGNTAAGVAALATYLTDNPETFYRALVPREWAGEATFPALCALYETTTSKFYFHVTVTQENYTNFTSQMKSVFTFLESPNAVLTSEFGAAWPFFVLLNLRPSATNKVTPTAFSFGFAVTPYPLKGNGALFATLKTASVNWAGTGAEGGISTTCLFWGTTMDGRDGSFWYGVDWAQINIDLNISNAIINGSNSQPPLDYNQNGINALQAVAADTLATGIAYGMLVGTVVQTELDQPTFNSNYEDGDYAGMAVINAIPFATYLAVSPSDYPAGIYNGFTAVITIARGFITIGFVINVTDFAAA